METILQDYLTHTKKNDIIPTHSGFVLYCMDDRKLSYTDAKEQLREYKGIINIYTKASLELKISIGGRNSQNYIQYLKMFLDENKDNIELDDRVVINISDDDNGVLDE